MGRPVGDLKLVTAHLGAGASLAAVAKGKSIDTTMGFTPLAGLMMATRSGDVDPGLVMWLLNNSGLTAPEVGHALQHRSGLLGISGVSGDLREVLKAAEAGDPRAILAYGVYLHRLKARIASMAAAMGGHDGVVFTGGVGQNSSKLRQDCSERVGVSWSANRQHRQRARARRPPCIARGIDPSSVGGCCSGGPGNRTRSTKDSRINRQTGVKRREALRCSTAGGEVADGPQYPPRIRRSSKWSTIDSPHRDFRVTGDKQ